MHAVYALHIYEVADSGYVKIRVKHVHNTTLVPQCVTPKAQIWINSNYPCKYYSVIAITCTLTTPHLISILGHLCDASKIVILLIQKLQFMVNNDMLKILPIFPILLLLRKFHHHLFRVVFILFLAGEGSRQERELSNHVT